MRRNSLRASAHRRWTFLLRPGWIALALVVVAFAYLCFTVLAPWQLGKNTRTSRENDQIASSVNAAPVPVASLLSQSDSAQWRPVTATGHYIADTTVLARLRLVEGSPAFEVLTPFAVDNGPTVLIDRGYVRPLQGTRVPPMAPPPSGQVTVTARLRDSEAKASKVPITEDGMVQVYSINTEEVGAVTKTPLAQPYLQLTDNQPGGLGVLPLPHLDAGPFLSYGIQWIAFGIIAPIGLGYFVFAELRERRRETASTPQSEAPATPEQKIADRYGRRR
jgi:cytochrome oxidase assembly protein ShyY1